MVGGFYVLLYIAVNRQRARLFLQSSELAPQPQEIVSPLLWSGGGWGGAHSLAGEGGPLYGVDVTTQSDLTE